MSEPHDAYDLDRFVEAQSAVMEDVCAELRAGRKRSHWMWFVFPQIAGLGFSAMAVRYAIASRGEAVAYRRHPLLGARLVECTTLVTAVAGRSLNAILGSPDDLKFRSSMTLFAETADDPLPFVHALDRFCDGRRDARTIELLRTLA